MGSKRHSAIPPLAYIGLIGAFGPSIAAMILASISDGKAGVLNLIKKLTKWRVHLRWYLFVLLIPSLLLYVSILASRLFGFSLGQTIYSNLPLVIPSSILIALPFGPLPEELGWRGYALPKLLKRHNPLISSLVLGIFWTFWHIPAFRVPGVAIPSVFEVNLWTVILYLLSNTALCFIFTAVYDKTQGSVLIAILLHATSNASSNVLYSIFPDIESIVPHREVIYMLNILLMFILGIGMIVFGKDNNLKKS